MSADGPFHRLVSVARLPPEGTEVAVEATPEECAALAEDFGLPGIRSLTGRFRLAGTPLRVEVTGGVRAEITQTCVVTLDPFDAEVDEEVAAEFVARDERAPPSGEADPEQEVDEIVDGRIDLGALAAEFLALGLDPYPRKPGAVFRQDSLDPHADSAFSALKGLVRRE